MEEKTSEETLEKYLREFGYGGVTPASFTLDPRKAQQKLGTFAMAAGLWAVKLVQCAVALNADRAEFETRRGPFGFKLQGPSSPNLKTLLENLLLGRSETDRARAHLAVALRAVLTQRPRRLRLESCCAGERTRVELIDGSLKASTSQGDGMAPSSLILQLEIVAPEHRDEILHQFEELGKRCYLCPVPVYIDGAPVSLRPVPYFATIFAPVRGDAPVLDLPPLTGAVCRIPHDSACSGALMWGLEPSTKTTRPKAYWYRDGVLLGPVALSAPPVRLRLDLILPGQDLPVDLSGWAVIDPQASFPARLALDAARTLLERLPRGPAPSSSQAEAVDLLWLGGAAVVAAAVCLFCPTLGALTMAGLCTMPGPRRVRPVRHEELISALRIVANEPELRLMTAREPDADGR